ncbi:hypothetical protein [Kineococcus glutinatus]|uniref:Antigen 84 n=1 Tax=Kineococcus glutinatus TaxID=1070872 RepID=A0ABP9HKU7_9ACTN
MSSTTTDEILHTPRFSPARRGGYLETEVDAFVERALATVLDLQHRLAASEDARADAEARLHATPGAGTGGAVDTPTRALRLLEMAQQSADAAVADAQQEAERLLADAQERAAAREDAARQAAADVERASRERQAELEAETADLLESERAARLQVHELVRHLNGVLEKYHEDGAGTPQ